MSFSSLIALCALRIMSIIINKVSKALMGIISTSVVPLHRVPAVIAMLTFSYFLKLPYYLLPQRFSACYSWPRMTLTTLLTCMNPLILQSQVQYHFPGILSLYSLSPPLNQANPLIVHSYCPLYLSFITLIIFVIPVIFQIFHLFLTLLSCK